MNILILIAILCLVVGGGMLLWKSKTPEGFNWMHGIVGLFALATAAYEIITKGLIGLF